MSLPLKLPVIYFTRDVVLEVLLIDYHRPEEEFKEAHVVEVHGLLKKKLCEK